MTQMPPLNLDDTPLPMIPPPVVGGPVPKRKKSDPPLVYDPACRATCTQCALASDRTQVVPGHGPRSARVVIVGEAPGRDEDAQGMPFVGASGRLLDRLLAGVGIRREDCFVTNAVSCWPPAKNGPDRARWSNGTPTAEQVKVCRGWLLGELATLDPDLIIALGAKASYTLTGDAAVEVWRGTVREPVLPSRGGPRPVPVFTTYHPAYALRLPAKRAILERDFAKAAAVLAGTVPPATTTQWAVALTPAEVRDLVDTMIAHGGPVAFDTECAGDGDYAALTYHKMELLCVSFSWEPGGGTVVPLVGQLPREDWDEKTGRYRVSPPRLHTPEDEQRIVAELQRFFSSGIPLIGQNAKYDRHALISAGIVCPNPTFDTLLAHALCFEDDPHSLEDLRVQYTQVPYYEDWKRQLPRKGAPYCLASCEDLWGYAVADTDVTLQVTPPLVAALQQEGPGPRKVYQTITLPLADAVFHLERQGALVDVPRLLELQATYQALIAAEEERLYQHAGRRFLYTSNQQLARLFYGKKADGGLGFAVAKETKTHAPSVDADAITHLAQRYPDEPVLQALLRLRGLHKTRDTYLAGKDGVGGLLRHVAPDGCIHTQYNVGRVVTGRLSSEKPNLQNVTKKDAYDDDPDTADETVRSLFVAPPGYLIVESDYSQLELRLQAYICEEQVLLDAFARGPVDQHKLTASLAYHIPVEQVTKEQRQDGKRGNFALGFGGGAPAIMRITGWDRDRAQQFVTEVNAGYPATTRKRRIAAQELARVGYVENRFGRRRHLPGYRTLLGESASLGRFHADQGRLRADLGRMERQAFNHWIQSTGSDVLSYATIEIVLATTDAGRALRALGAIPFLTLHDALYFYVPEARVAEATALIRQIMEGVPARYGRPDMQGWFLPVDITWGERWGVSLGESKGADLAFAAA